MNDPQNDLTLMQMLALAYARGDSRDFLALLLRYDARLGAILSNGKEPLIGQMRLAWWRDVIERPAAGRPIGEPLLAALTALEQTPIGGTAAQSMARLTDAWGELLANEVWTPAVLASHFEARSVAIFGGYAAVKAMTGRQVDTAIAAGRCWAAAELAGHCRLSEQYDAVSAQVAAILPQYRLPARLRPLTILAFAAIRQHAGQGDGTARNPVAGLRMIFNALTGR